MRSLNKEELKKELTLLFPCQVTHFEQSPKAEWWVYFRSSKATINRLSIRFKDRFLEYLGDDEYRVSTAFKEEEDN